MGQRKRAPRRLLARFVVFTLAGWVLVALGRQHDRRLEEEAREATLAEPQSIRGTHVTSEADESWEFPRPTLSMGRRLATSLVFATLFFAGAAFSAGAGDVLVGITEDPAAASEEETTTDETTGEEPDVTETEPTETEPAEPPEGDGDEPVVDGGGVQEDPTDEPADGGGDSEVPADPGSDTGSEGDGGAPAEGEGGGSEGPAPTVDPPLLPHEHEHQDETAAQDPEVEEAAYATVWLHRVLPDPTPPAKRLAPAFARRLRTVARKAGVDWALVLGVLRARNQTGRVPASPKAVRRLADRLDGLGAARDAWAAVLALKGSTAFADRAVALQHYNRAVGLRALVIGLAAAKPALVKAVLADRRIQIYSGGRVDVASRKTDVRVLVLLRYLAETHGSVTVSSLTTGHGLYARPGVVSAHIYGLAADISALGGVSILGHQDPEGITEKGVRSILLLPRELQPRQVISLLGLGGPSFPLANHHDHIHVGF